MTWTVEFDEAFEPEFESFDEEVQDALLALAKLLADYGPQLGRPHADTLKGSKYVNMKELRFKACGGEWRAVFAFDPQRRNPACRRRQIRQKPGSFLQAAHRQGGPSIFGSFGNNEVRQEGKIGWARP